MNVCVSLQAAQQRVNELNSRYEILPKKQNTFFFLAVLPKQKYHTLQEMYNRIQSSHEQSSTVPKFPSKVVLCSSSVVSDSVTPWTIVRYIYIYSSLYVYRLLCPWDFPGKNTRVGCHFLLQPSRVTWYTKNKNDVLDLFSIILRKYNQYRSILRWLRY